MIKDIKFKIDKNDIVGLRSNIILQYKPGERALDKTYLRIETLIMLGKNYVILPAMTTNNNIFVGTESYMRNFYFPFLNVNFIGKAIVKVNYQREIIGMAVSEVDYKSFPMMEIITEALQNRKPGVVADGTIPIIWKPVQLNSQIENAVRMFCQTFIY